MAVMSEIAQLQDELNHLERELSKLYRLREPILVRLAELRGPAELPKPRYQTDKQRAVSRCPRCGMRHDGGG